ncbi:hypothetical protein [Oryza sativa Japonica Group]|uniref:Uncharacterized protein n=1 Tax=Oryza sativa subsp. japonica TaxID=39947 RepID=Q5N9P4_ORYSJ|nr:hypothetical protein [Oryza sativa Japonica Group]
MVLGSDIRREGVMSVALASLLTTASLRLSSDMFYAAELKRRCHPHRHWKRSAERHRRHARSWEEEECSG